MIKYITVIALLIFCGLSSCGTTDSTNNTPSTETINNFPLSVNYWWDYKMSQPTDTSEYRRSIATTKNINGKEYYMMVTQGYYVNDTSYYRFDKNIVYMAHLNNGLPNNTETIQFNFNNSEGDSTVEILSYLDGRKQKNVITTLKTKGYELTTATGVHYSNYTGFSVEVSMGNATQWEYSYKQNFYFAKDIGLVYITLENKGTIELINYSFKK